MGVYLQSVLNQIGYKASVKPISGNIFFTYVQNTKNKVQINVQQWYQDYPAASDFLYILFGCETFHPGSDSSINIAGFCDKKINAQMHTALEARYVEREHCERPVVEDRPDGDERGADGDAVHAEAHRLRVEAGRQLHLQQAVLLARRPVMGEVGIRARAGRPPGPRTARADERRRRGGAASPAGGARARRCQPVGARAPPASPQPGRDGDARPAAS